MTDESPQGRQWGPPGQQPPSGPPGGQYPPQAAPQQQSPAPLHSTVVPTGRSVTALHARKVAVGGLVLGIALGVGATLLITSGGNSGSGGSDPAQAAACAKAADLQKKVDSGPPKETVLVNGFYKLGVSPEGQSMYNAEVSQLATQTALCHAH